MTIDSSQFSDSLADDSTEDYSRNSVSDIEFIGEVTFATGTTFEGTEVGGLSGITYDAEKGVYYAISDDRSQINPARFYELSIDLSDGSLDAGDVTIQDVTTLTDEAGNAFAEGTIDLEGIALSEDGTLYISSEGDADNLVDPFVDAFSLSGQETGALPIPEKFLPTEDQSSGIRNNLAFESLTLSPDGRYLYTATENALYQDGPEATPEDESPSRILRFDLTTGQPDKEYLYYTEPVPAGGEGNNGLVELLALDNDGNFLALERAYVDGVGNTLRLYQVQLQNTTDLRDTDALDGLEVDAVAQKNLLLDFSELGVTLDNFEGMSLGDVLPDGRQSLTVVSDNNFSEDQATKFFTFALDLQTTRAVAPVTETPSVIDDEDLASELSAIPGDADDPAIWVNPSDSGESLVIATLKDGGLISFNLDGSVNQTIASTPEYGDIRYNNVDLVYGFELGGKTVDLAVATDRHNDTLDIWTIDPQTRQLSKVTAADLSDAAASIFGVDDGEQTAYGLATYTSPSGETYVFVSQREGNQIAQLRLIANDDGTVSAETVRTLSAPIPDGKELADAQFEGMVVDRETGYLYAAQEQRGIWKFAADPDAPTEGTLIEAVKTEGNVLTADAEGLTIYYGKDGAGYLLASSQGDSSFAVFSREGDNDYLGSFVVDDGVDGVAESDGADVINVGLGDQFPNGLLVVHDGSNEPAAVSLDGEEVQNLNTNFKFIDWADVANAFETPLEIDPNGYDPRNPQSQLPESQSDVTTQEQLNEQSILAINWAQESGEYAAVSYQAYNLAKIAFDQALADGVENPSVVLDLDETVLDNSAYQAGLVGTDNAYSSSTWSEWILSENATAIPGAIEFINYVTDKGGKVFFISDRDESSTDDTNNNDLEQATIDNLIKLGITDANDENVLLRGEFTGLVDGEVSTSKEYRRIAVEDGSADGIDHETVVLVGDNLNDFDDDAGTTNVDRRDYVETHQDQYGVYSDGTPAYIVLPNAQYGAWEGPGLYDPAQFGKEQWFELTPEEKSIQRKVALDIWDAPDELEVGVTSGGAQDRLNEQSVLAINWTQEAGEFDALAYQSYNAARVAFDQALADGAENPAVVLDLDETVLDNSAYQAWLVDKDIQYSSTTWEAWILSEDAKAVSGAIEFINYVTAKGGKVFFISDRDESSTDDTNNNDLEQATIDNLIKLGVKDANDANVLLRGEFTGLVDGEVSTSKEYRRIAVEDGSADGIDHNTVVLVGDNLNDLDDDAGVLNGDRRDYVNSIQDRYGVYSEGEPAYIPLSNPQYGAWEQGLYDPAAFDKAQWFLLDPAEKNIQRQQTLTRWTTESGEVFTDYPATPDGTGGKNLFEFRRGDSLGLIVNFGGVGNSKTVSEGTIAEADTLQFIGAGLTAENLLLTQRGTDVVVGFDGVLDTQVLLKNINVEDLDNLSQAGDSPVVSNILFNGDTIAVDSFDVFDADSSASTLWHSNSTTFLNDLDNTVAGFADSDDVINAQGGDDHINGLSGDDTIRGGDGADVLFGNDGEDVLAGNAGNDTVTGGTGSDRFVLAANAGTDTVTDFSVGEDLLELSPGLSFADLTLSQGTGNQSNAALISVTATQEVLAVLTGVQSSAIGSASFVAA